MANKKDDLKIDDLLHQGDIDSLFGDDDLDFDSLFADDVSDKREPVSLKNIGKKSIEKMKEVDSDRIKQAIDASIPKKLQGDYDTIKEIYGSASEVLGQQAGLIKKDLKDLGKKLDKVLPEEGKIRNLFNKFYSREEEYRAQRQSEEQRRQEEIIQNVNATLGNFTDIQEQAAAVNNILQDKRTASTNEILKSISAATQAQKIYSFEYASKFQRRSLELQYKQAALLQDILSLTKESAHKQNEQLKAIIKNTGLPDLLKQRQVEMFGGDLKARTRAWAATKLIDQNEPLKRYKEKIKRRIKVLASDIRDGINAGSDAAEAYEMGSDMGMNGNDLAADFVRSQTDKFVGKNVLDFLFNSGPGRWLTSKIRSFTDDPSGKFRDLRKRIKGDGILQDAGRTLLSEAAYLTDTRPIVGKADLGRADLDGADSFDTRTKMTINRVIPGYLRKIHGEIKAVRMGYEGDDTTGFELSYSHDRDKFISRSKYKNLLDHNVSSSLAENTKYTHYRLASTIYGRDGESWFKEKGYDPIQEKEMTNILQAMTRASLATGANGLEFLRSDELKKVLPEKYHNRLGQIIEYVEERSQDKDDPYYYDDLRSSIHNVRKSIPDVNKEIEALFKNGDVEELEEKGLITYDERSRTYRVDQQKVLDFLFSSYNIADNTVKDDLEKGLFSVRKSARKWKVRTEKTKRWVKANTPEEVKQAMAATKAVISKNINTLYDRASNASQQAYKQFSQSAKNASVSGATGFFKTAYNKIPDDVRKEIEAGVDKSLVKTEEFYQEVFTSLPDETQKALTEAVTKGKNLSGGDIKKFFGGLKGKAKGMMASFSNRFSSAVSNITSDAAKQEMLENYNVALGSLRHAREEMSEKFESSPIMDNIARVSAEINQKRDKLVEEMNATKKIDIMKVYRQLEILDAAMRTNSIDAIDEAIKTAKQAPEAAHELMSKAIGNAILAREEMKKLGKAEAEIAVNDPDPNSKAGRLRRMAGGLWNMLPISPVLKAPLKLLWGYASLTWKLEKFLVKNVVWPSLKFATKLPFKLAKNAIVKPIELLGWMGRKVGDSAAKNVKEDGWIKGLGKTMMAPLSPFTGLMGMWGRNLMNPLNPMKTLFGGRNKDGGKTGDRTQEGKLAKAMGLFSGRSRIINGREVKDGQDPNPKKEKKSSMLGKILAILGVIGGTAATLVKKLIDLPGKLISGIGSFFFENGRFFVNLLKVFGKTGIKTILNGISLGIRGLGFLTSKIPLPASIKSFFGGGMDKPDPKDLKPPKDNIDGKNPDGSATDKTQQLKKDPNVKKPPKTPNVPKTSSPWYSWDGIKNGFKRAGQAVVDGVSYVGDKIVDGYRWAKNKAGQILECTKEAMKKYLIDPMKKLWKNLVEKFKGRVAKALGKKSLSNKSLIRIVGKLAFKLLTKASIKVLKIAAKVVGGVVSSGGLLSILFLLWEMWDIITSFWNASSFLGGVSNYLFGCDLTTDEGLRDMIEDPETQAAINDPNATSIDPESMFDENPAVLPDQGEEAEISEAKAEAAGGTTGGTPASVPAPPSNSTTSGQMTPENIVLNTPTTKPTLVAGSAFSPAAIRTATGLEQTVKEGGSEFQKALLKEVWEIKDILNKTLEIHRRGIKLDNETVNVFKNITNSEVVTTTVNGETKVMNTSSTDVKKMSSPIKPGNARDIVPQAGYNMGR